MVLNKKDKDMDKVWVQLGHNKPLRVKIKKEIMRKQGLSESGVRQHLLRQFDDLRKPYKTIIRRLTGIKQWQRGMALIEVEGELKFVEILENMG